MFRTILVPLDGSFFAEQALPWALSLARRGEASLDLARVHVVYALQDPTCARLPYDGAAEAKCKEEEQLYLNATARWLAAISPVSVSSALLNGMGADALLEQVRARRADLVVMTTHARSPVGRFFLGSVADELLRRAEVPVLLVRPREPAPTFIPEPSPEHILVPLDGSPLAEEALDVAVDMARLSEGRCTLLRVIDPNASHEAEASAYLATIVGRLGDRGVTARSRVVIAPHPAEAILGVAGSVDSDLIVMATHGRGGLQRMVLGSVADRVIRGADSPVLVCPPRGR
jgi:nucleotide-binding universal stress UspA family protein